jgi:hypothetical protein
MVALSKDGTSYPKANDIRTIGILPIYTKVIELIILQKLNPILYGPNGIVPTQQLGFRPGNGCYDQLSRFFSIMEEMRRLDVINHKAKRAGKDKTSNFLIFIDLKKGYDYVCRDRLCMALMRERRIP